nr:basic proline-rich protein-like [Delphinus delphis]
MRLDGIWNQPFRGNQSALQKELTAALAKERKVAEGKCCQDDAKAAPGAGFAGAPDGTAFKTQKCICFQLKVHVLPKSCKYTEGISAAAGTPAWLALGRARNTRPGCDRPRAHRAPAVSRAGGAGPALGHRGRVERPGRGPGDGRPRPRPPTPGPAQATSRRPRPRPRPRPGSPTPATSGPQPDSRPRPPRPRPRPDDAPGRPGPGRELAAEAESAPAAHSPRAPGVGRLPPGCGRRPRRRTHSHSLAAALSAPAPLPPPPPPPPARPRRCRTLHPSQGPARRGAGKGAGPARAGAVPICPSLPGARPVRPLQGPRRRNPIPRPLRADRAGAVPARRAPPPGQASRAAAGLESSAGWVAAVLLVARPLAADRTHTCRGAEGCGVTGARFCLQGPPLTPFPRLAPPQMPPDPVCGTPPSNPAPPQARPSPSAQRRLASPLNAAPPQASKPPCPAPP